MFRIRKLMINTSLVCSSGLMQSGRKLSDFEFKLKAAASVLPRRRLIFFIDLIY